MSNSTRPDLAAIRARLDAATPGPWFTPDERRLQGAVSTRIGDRECQVASIDGDAAMFDHRAEPHEVQRANASFIAHARQDVEQLVARVEFLERLIDAVAHDVRIVTEHRAARERGGQHVGTGGPLSAANPSTLVYLERLVLNTKGPTNAD